MRNGKSTDMQNPKGSVWRKWDLHVHTPDSLVNSYGSLDAWDKFITALQDLPPEFKVLGINDYVFVDGYKKLIAAKAEGRLPNIELLLPVIELRLDKFGGSKSGLSRVNYHIIFSNEISPEVIESQFLSALCSKYVLTPEFDELRTSGKWAAVPTRKSIEDLGSLIIESVPLEERAKFHAPIIEGFNNLCLNLSDIQKVLESQYFAGKTLTAVGKTEWADIKWNDHSIADKKTIINSADLVFISSASVDDFRKSQKSLTDSGVNDRLLDCSDAHHFADAGEKDRLGKCFTWIKADPTFEGLRQAAFEYPNRIHVSENSPLEPLLKIESAKFNFPETTELRRGERTDVFCFRGKTEIVFSPYLTCIIGGRGTGKSTLLNLIHENLDPDSTEFFKENKLTPASVSVADSVRIEGIAGQSVVEFLQQNEIEQFATDHKRLTTAIFSRLRKLDTKGLLKEKDISVLAALATTEKQFDQVKENHSLSVRLSNAEKELKTQRGLVDSFQNTNYTRINDELAVLNKELQRFKSSKARLDTLIQGLRSLRTNSPALLPDQDVNLNAYEQQAKSIVAEIDKWVKDTDDHPSLAAARTHEQTIAGKISALRSELEKFLRERGLSAENLSDVGSATETIAQLEEEIASLKTRIAALQTEMSQFSSKRAAALQYAKAVEELLAPINAGLTGQSNEVKPIELRYSFDVEAFRASMIQYVASLLSG